VADGGFNEYNAAGLLFPIVAHSGHAVAATMSGFASTQGLSREWLFCLDLPSKPMNNWEPLFAGINCTSIIDVVITPSPLIQCVAHC
jgi:hypothetical protein